MKIAVLGGGAWGSVLASLLADTRHDVALWEVDQAAAAALRADRRGPRSLPDHLLPASIAVTDDVATAVHGRALLVLAVPSETINATLAAARAALGDGVIIACAS